MSRWQRAFSPFEAWLYEGWIAGGVIDVVAPLIAPHVLGAGRVLDVGCGGGLLGRRLGGGVIGVDAAFGQARRARGVCGSADALPFGSSTFDAVVSSCSIKHWPDPAAGVVECRRVLRPGGALVVAEMDRAATRAEMAAFAARTRVPRLLRRAYVEMDVRTVLPAALTADELGALVGTAPIKVDGQPYLVAVWRG